VTHPHLLLHILVRWVDLVALVTLVGGLIYHYFVWSPLSKGVGRGIGIMIPVLPALLVLGAAALVDLVLRAAMMSGRPFTDLTSVLPIVLMKTQFGHVWTWKLGLIITLTVLWFLKMHKKIDGPTVMYALLAGGAAVDLTTALSGHAADQGIRTWTVLVDWVHVMAVSGWVGGQFALQLHFRPSLAGLPELGLRVFLAGALRRFSTVAMTAVGAMLITGVYNVWFHVHSLPLLTGTEYGKFLILKSCLVVLMVLLGGVIRFYALPILESRDGWGPAALLARSARAVIERIWTRPRNMGRWCFRVLLIEALLGLAVLGCTAALTQLPPPHERPSGYEHSQHAM
jgi:putative copper export protein